MVDIMVFLGVFVGPTNGPRAPTKELAQTANNLLSLCTKLRRTFDGILKIDVDRYIEFKISQRHVEW